MFKNTPFRIKFLIFVLVLYLVAFFIDSGYTKTALLSTLKLFYSIIPLLAFVFVLNAIVNKYLKPEIVERYIGEKKGLSKVVYAIVLGIIISGPPYILYPMFGELKQRGAGNDFLAIVLFNRNVKIPFVPLMIYYFGLSYTVVVSVLIILFSVLNGYFVAALMKERA